MEYVKSYRQKRISLCLENTLTRRISSKIPKAWLDDGVTRILDDTAQDISERYEIKVESFGIEKDHIHLFCGANPKIALGRIVFIFKSWIIWLFRGKHL